MRPYSLVEGNLHRITRRYSHRIMFLKRKRGLRNETSPAPPAMGPACRYCYSRHPSYTLLRTHPFRGSGAWGRGSFCPSAVLRGVALCTQSVLWQCCSYRRQSCTSVCCTSLGRSCTGVSQKQNTLAGLSRLECGTLEGGLATAVGRTLSHT